MAIAVRSVKAGMTTFGYLRSRLKDGAKLGCRGAAIGPRLGRLHGVHVYFGALGVRNLTQNNINNSRTKNYTALFSLVPSRPE